LDSLTVEVEAETQAATTYDVIAKDVQHHIKAMVGITCDVVVLSPGSVPRSTGKAIRVKDLRNVT
jgi:phenylacetate-CoA ligase